MMRRILAAFAAAGLFSCQAMAAAVPPPAGTIIQAPQWVLGSEWYYSDGYAVKVTSVTPQATVFDRIDAPGQWFSREGFIRKDSASDSATRNAIYRTIGAKDGLSLSAGAPLTFQREYLSNGTLMVHASSWTVEGRETITVPAGTFDCWLIVWRTRSLKSDWTGFERWWYSPQAQHYVRMEYKYGLGAEGSRVLMRYHIGLEAVSASATTSSAPTPLVTKSEAPIPVIVVAAQPPVVRIGSPGPAAERHADTPTAVSVAPVGRGADKPSEPASMASASPAPPPPASTGGAWHAQIGSSKDMAAMRVSLQKTLAANSQLAKLPHGITPHAVAGRGTFYRAWFGEYDKQGDARAVCETLSGKGPGCSVFKGQTREIAER